MAIRECFESDNRWAWIPLSLAEFRVSELEQRIATIEADLRAAVAALKQVIDCWNSAAQEPAGRVCDVCIAIGDAVLSRPGVAALHSIDAAPTIHPLSPVSVRADEASEQAGGT